MSRAVALLAAPAARRARVDGRAGEVEIALRSGAYITVGLDWVLLAQAGSAFGPLSLAVRSPGQLAFVPGTPVQVGGKHLVVGDATVSLEWMRERPPLSLSPAAATPARAITEVLATIADELPRPPAYLHEGLDALSAGSSDAAVRSLAGRGEGLTPAGDDVLAGYAAWHATLPDGRAGASTAGEPLVSELAAPRSSPLGLAYLRCAERGELVDAGAELSIAIGAGSAVAARAAIARLRAWGASSGSALAWGILAGAAATTGTVPPACQA
jgi:hypothetical protein